MVSLDPNQRGGRSLHARDCRCTARGLRSDDIQDYHLNLAVMDSLPSFLMVNPEVASIYSQVDQVYLHNNSQAILTHILKLNFVPAAQSKID